jgi:4-hydroxy-4-methyl-2-oxoglutarate aldolase
MDGSALHTIDIAQAFDRLSTPLLADALVRLGLPLRVAPREIQPAVGTRLAGRALPARHTGSVDVLLEAIDAASPGDVLVIDNGGRTDEACVGDLIAVEASVQGVAGLAVWGAHRDSNELTAIGLTVFSCARCPNGPLRARDREPDALTRARMGWQLVERGDVVFADADGMLFLSERHLAAILPLARDIAMCEREQAVLVRQGRSLRAQFRFKAYLERREANPQYTLRRHLKEVGGAIEE